MGHAARHPLHARRRDRGSRQRARGARRSVPGDLLGRRDYLRVPAQPPGHAHRRRPAVPARRLSAGLGRRLFGRRTRRAPSSRSASTSWPARCYAIDPVTGLGLPDNPYYDAGAPASNRSRVYAYGFRNPFRMALDAGGDLYVGDVGEVRWEEVDRVVAGGNYGWPCFEGADPGTAPAGAADCTAVRSGPSCTASRCWPIPRRLRGLDDPGRVLRRRCLPGGVRRAAVPRRLHAWAGSGPSTPTRRRPGWRTSECHRPSVPARYALGPDGTVWYADVALGRIRSLVYDPEQTSCPSGEFLSETFRNRLFEPESDCRGLGHVVRRNPAGRPRPGGARVAQPGQRLVDALERHPAARARHLRADRQVERAPRGPRRRGRGARRRHLHGRRHRPGRGVGGRRRRADQQPRLRRRPVLRQLRLGLPAVLDAYRRSARGDGHRSHPEGGGCAPATPSRGRCRPPTPRTGPSLRARCARTWWCCTTARAARTRPCRVGNLLEGGSGTAAVEDTHAPGKVVYRVTGVAVDSSGWVAESPPVYVCLAGNNVGPCA